VRRLLIALGLLAALTGALMCWPLLHMLATHEHGGARILEVLSVPRPDGRTGLRVLWEVEATPGNWLLGDAQSDRFFKRVEDPAMSRADFEEVASRLRPDRQGSYRVVKAFWTANDPAGTAFIIDVSRTHPWRRYIAGVALCGLGLIAARLAWAYGRWRPAR
jgi:hypothetical protein